jgi:lysine 2,3-aminomutase
MSMRVSPYLMALMNWEDPYSCPLRKQFIPVGDQLLADHPQLHLDSLHEQEDSPVPGLTHRYADKVLFLPLDTCPVYCRFCTRSYSIGVDTEEVEKTAFRVDYNRWRQAFAYLASRPEVEDVVVSGGDSYNLKPDQLEGIGMTLLQIPHIRRIRFATKGLAICPQKVISHTDWLEAVTRVVEFGRSKHKDVVIHTHFNHPTEITWISQRALGLLHERGITVRNQAVLLRGVNDSVETLAMLVRRLSYINVHPYYVYLCDMVKGVEDLRTSLAAAERIEKGVRGVTAGFNTPTFVCDTPGGGGKRCLHSYEYYNRETGVAIYTAPSVKPGKFFVYCDPLHTLSEAARQRWANPQEQQVMIDQALAEAQKRLAS